MTAKKPRFQAPPHLVDAARDAGLAVPPRPKEPVKILGAMVTDCDILTEEIGKLPFAGNDYVSALRVIRGAAKRIQDAVDALGLDK